MKKFIILYFILYVFSYSSYLVTNSEIVLFYGEENKKIEYIRGDIFDNISISQIDYSLIINNHEIINLQNYLKKTSKIAGTNILLMTYEIEESEIKLYIVPSMVERQKLYILMDLSKFKLNYDKIDMAIKISPQYDNEFILLNPNSFKYEKFNFRSENYNGDLYLAKNSRLEDLILQKINKKTKKYENDNMYFIIPNIKEDIIFDISFYEDLKLQKENLGIEDIINREFKYWGINKQIKNSLFLENLVDLKLMTSRAIIPNKIDLDRSQEDLNNKMKLYYIKSLWSYDFNVNKFFEDINLRKKDGEAVLYYAILYKYMNEKNKYLDKYLFDKKVRPEILTLLDYIKLNDNEIYTIRDNIENYFWYYVLLENIKNRPEFKEDKQFINSKEELLLNYIKKNYVLDTGLKTRITDKKANYKNIKYMDFMPASYQEKIINQDYKRYYNKKYEILMNSKDMIDLEYNLNFIEKLYQNKNIELGDKLFKTISKISKENNDYLLEKVYINENNQSGIYGEMLYLYFNVLGCREKNNVRNNE